MEFPVLRNGKYINVFIIPSLSSYFPDQGEGEEFNHTRIY